MSRKSKVVVPVSGNLIASTLTPVLERLGREPSTEVVCVADGTKPVYRDFPFPLVDSSRVSEASLRAAIAEPDLVVDAPTFAVGDIERRIMGEAERRGAPRLMYLCDMGRDFVLPKWQRRRELPCDHVLVTDPRTYRCLLADGVESPRLVQAGSPLLDRTLLTPARAAAARRPRILYADVIWDLDYATGRLACGPYAKQRYLDEVRNAAARPDADFAARLHPKSDANAFAGLPVDAEADADRSIACSDVVISSYSTMLFQAFLLGVPAISYQPWPSTIRADVFDGRVEVVKSAERLRSAIERALAAGSRRRPVIDATVLYNPGSAADFVADFMMRLLREERTLPALAIGQ